MSELETYNKIIFGKEELERDQVVSAKKLRALDRAWEIRNFEIGLYWKRALYFWGFIALAFTGYFSILDNHASYALVIACAGFVFSVAWFRVNKASKFWQENWEAHIDCLENEIEGQIYKTVLKNKTSPIHPLKGYYFSVSKINQATNIFVIIIWIFLVIISPTYEGLGVFDAVEPYIFPIVFVLTVVISPWFLGTSFTNKNKLKSNLILRIFTCLKCPFKSKFKPLKSCKYTYFERNIEDN